jgi:hypothetical protein
MQNTASLASIVSMVRAEAGHSMAVSQGQNTIDTIKALIARTQTELWTAYQWPTLKIRADRQMSSGSFLYDFQVNMSFEQVREVWASQSSSYSWTPVNYGIEENMIAPGAGNSQSGDPPQFWDTENNSSDSVYRIWPTPTTSNYTVRMIGMRRCDPLLVDADVSTLDATAISLFVAAELLARAKAEDAPMKLQKAQKYTLALMGNSVTAKRKISTLASGAPSNRGNRATPYIDYIPQSN